MLLFREEGNIKIAFESPREPFPRPFQLQKKLIRNWRVKVLTETLIVLQNSTTEIEVLKNGILTAKLVDNFSKQNIKHRDNSTMKHGSQTTYKAPC